MNKNSKIYIAGHRGLVGSAIVKNLQSKGYTNIITRTHSELDLINQKAVVEFFEEEKPEYVILAAAKVGGIVANNTYRADFIYENLQIQNNIIHLSFVHKVKKLLFLGSTCIYPKDATQPMSEDCLLTSELEYTNEPYAIAKIAGIKMCESYNIQYGTNFISVMPTNLYGPNDNFDLETSHVLPALLRKMHLGKLLESVKWEELSTKNDDNWEAIKEDLNKNPIKCVKCYELGTKKEDKIITGESSKQEILDVLEEYGIRLHNTEFVTPNTNLNKVQIEIWGSGNPRREFLHSEDMADACVYLMENINFKEIIKQELNTECLTLNTANEIRNTHINIGTGEDISIKELAFLIKDIIGFKGELYFNTQKPDGTIVKLTNPSKLNNFGWKYKTKLKEGILNIYEWYIKNIAKS
ncbi:GDP-L-fucose synthase [Aliarcobacter cryaerophilus]|uniref:GDP-L-fucose synthase family protein n=1 Tax=Aliarcobacter cryaerophilus TaxID=28198 RepID=UPI0021B190D5|nr:GDP-L-fucose synthase [Aliarcobacter cryaerophilus]MCT7522587.1 GDP-L-fucose synthase [Aliarcobacter cryaerophilus]